MNAEPPALPGSATHAAEVSDLTEAGSGWLLDRVKDRRIAFAIVGATNTAVGFVTYVILLRAFSMPYMPALVIAYAVAIGYAFLAHRHFVFRVRGHVLRDLARFVLVNLGAFAINAAALPFAVEVVGLGPIVAQLVVTAVSMVLTYVGHRDFSFRRKPR